MLVGQCYLSGVSISLNICFHEKCWGHNDYGIIYILCGVWVSHKVTHVQKMLQSMQGWDVSSLGSYVAATIEPDSIQRVFSSKPVQKRHVPHREARVWKRGSSFGCDPALSPGYFDSEQDTKNIVDRLHRGYMLFKLWCLANSKTPSLKNFTKANLHMTGSPFPYLGGKGSDTTLVLMFLQFFIPMCQREMKHPDHRDILGAVMQLTESLLNFISLQYSHDLWLPTKCAEFMYLEGLVALRAYNYAAQHGMDMGKPLFGLRPKFHSLAETVFETKQGVANGHPYILTPLTFSCEGNEDFIGRVARISRRVSSRTCTLRTLQRYGVAFHAKLRRLKQVKKPNFAK